MKKDMRLTLAFYICILLSFCLHGEANSAGDSVPGETRGSNSGYNSRMSFVDKINENRGYLKNLAGKRPAKSEKQKKLVSLLESPIAKKATAKEEEFFIQSLFDLGRYPQGFDADTGSIEDEVVISILVSALESDLPEIRNQAFRYLIVYSRRDHISPHSEAIKSALSKFYFPDRDRLLALLPLNEEERIIMLAKKHPVEISARLGDKDSESRLIERFEEAKSYKEKRELAEMLAYVGSSRCAESLIKALNSKLMLKAPYEHVSVRVDIIKSLGKIHPDEPLLTRDIMEISHKGDDRYGGVDRIRDYLKKVYDWADENYGVVPEGLDPTPVLYKRIIIKHPLKKR